MRLFQKEINYSVIIIACRTFYSHSACAVHWILQNIVSFEKWHTDRHAPNFSFLRKIFRLPAEFFSEHTSGDLNSRISDAFNIRTFISEGLVSIFVSILTLVAVLVLMFTFYWRLALFTLLFIPLYAGLYFISDRINHKYTHDWQ